MAIRRFLIESGLVLAGMLGGEPKNEAAVAYPATTSALLLMFGSVICDWLVSTQTGLSPA